jgi:U6 snRNA-associated Sm-like protein LSm2
MMRHDTRTWSVKLTLLLLINRPNPIGQMAVKNCFIRGSVVRYVQLPASGVDTQLLEDATRKEASNQAKR